MRSTAGAPSLSRRCLVTISLLALLGGAVRGQRTGRVALKPRVPERAYALFLSPFGDDVYYQAVRVLIYWLKQDPLRCSCYPVVVMASDAVAPEKLQQLMIDGALVKRVTIPQIELNKDDISADRWAATMGKLHAFNLTEFREVVFIDGDFVLLEAMDSIFQYGDEHYDSHSYWMAAVPNSWGNTFDAMKLTNPEFNSGLMLLKPNEAHFLRILELGNANQGKFKMDQQLLNEYFKSDGPYPWRPLPPRYNRQFVRNLDDMQTDVVAVHEKAFWHHGPAEIWQMWEAGKQGVVNWDAQVELFTRLRKYQLTDLASRIQSGLMCPRRCPPSAMTAGNNAAATLQSATDVVAKMQAAGRRA